jgi:hypothetical protein
MFCDGICKTEEAICGLLHQMYQADPKGNKIPGTEYDRCGIGAILDALVRVEGRLVGVQAATESSRNQANRDAMEASKVMAQGWLGMMFAVQENPKARMRTAAAIENLSGFVKTTTETQKKLEEEHAKILKGESAEDSPLLDAGEKKGMLQ